MTAPRLVGQNLFDRVRRDQQGLRTDIGKDGLGAEKLGHVRRGNKRHGRNDDFIAGPDVERQQGRQGAVRPAIGQQGMGHTEERAELRLDIASDLA